jgi:hypothetical protein
MFKSGTQTCRTRSVSFLCRATVVALSALSAGISPQQTFAAQVYGIDRTASWVRVLVYRAGLLGRLGHNHVISMRQLQGCVQLAESIADSRVVIRMPVRDLLVDDTAEREAAGEDFPGDVAAADIDGTRKNMLGPALLQANRYPDITLRSSALAGQPPAMLLQASVQVRAREWPLALPLRVTLADNRVEVAGEAELSHADIGLRPFRAALGALRVADTLRLEYRLSARRLEDETAVSDCERALAVVDDVPVPDPAAE